MHSGRKIRLCLLIAFLAALLPLVAVAQLVADGATNILNAAATNVTGNLVVGTNGPFTSLLLTNSATVTNTGNVIIGQNVAAKSNSVAVIGTGSVWSASGGSYIGSAGDSCRLDILEGGVVTNQFAYVGWGGHSNTAVVSGPNSLWNMQWTMSSFYGSLRVGSIGSGNTLVITNGGKVADGFSYIGENTSSGSNTVVVTGAGSVWSHLSAGQYVGYNGSGNRLIITNGGKVVGGAYNIGFQGTNNSVLVTGTNSAWLSSGLTINSSWNQLQVRDGGVVSNVNFCTIGQYGNSNTVWVTDPGSLWTNVAYLIVGWSGPGNQLVVSNGAVVAAEYTQVGANGGSREKIIITGAGSLVTNRSDFFLGHAGSSNQLWVANGGRLVNNLGYIGYNGFNAISNQALVTDAGSVWTNRSHLHIGYDNARSLLVISNSGRVFNDTGYIGGNSAGSNLVFITDAGSLWSNRSDVVLGGSSSGNQLVVSNGGTVVAKNLMLGLNAGSNNVLTVNGGTVVISNFNNGNLSVQRGTVVLNSGLLLVDRLQMSGGLGGKFNFNGGTFQTRSASVLNSSAFTVGNGTSAATYLLGPSTHTFNNGLIVSSNAVLTGAGTVSGNVFVREGGTISPGTSNTLFMTLNSGLVLSNASITDIRLNAQSGQCSHFEGNTVVTLGGTLQLTNVAGALANGMSFRLFYTSNLHGAFNAITPPSPGFGIKWNTSQLSVDGTLRVLSSNTPPPAITSVDRLGAEIVIQATGGIPYDPCYVMTSTNLVDWQYVTTNAFDTTGSVIITNVISLDIPARFYRLQVE